MGVARWTSSCTFTKKVYLLFLFLLVNQPASITPFHHLDYSLGIPEMLNDGRQQNVVIA